MLAVEALNTNTEEGTRSKIREGANAPGIEIAGLGEAMKLVCSS
ncbi:MAG: hypothetical protein ACQJCO_09655 [cyanobacterium endosymbiont of Rhopalodia sterrenbergii]